MTTPPSSPLARSYLYVPGDAERLRRAHARGADAVIADLEDSVPLARKAEARRAVAAWLTGDLPGPTGRTTERWVRVNDGPTALEDVRSVFGPGLHGVCMAKVTGPEVVEDVADLLASLEARHGWTGPPVVIMPMVESAGGMLMVDRTASAPRVRRLQLGEIDLAADLGLDVDIDESELISLRTAVVVASAAADLQPPTGAVWPGIGDEEGLIRSTERIRRLGFFGRAVVHPRQVGPVHAVFTPSPDAVREAREAVARFDAAVDSGSGVYVDAAGQMVDEAVVRRSRRLLASIRSDEEQR